MKTDQIKEEIHNEHGNLSKVARVLGIDYHAMRQRFPDHQLRLDSARGPEPEDITTLGRPGFERYVIAVKRAGERWPVKYVAALSDARKKFDAGTHEMFQTPNSGWVVQYLIPYLIPVGRRQFFSTMIAM